MGSANLLEVRHLAIALIAVAVVGCNSEQKPTASVRFLGGGRDGFQAYLKERRGTPVVVNKWASWCGPCRAEFPVFRDEARRRKGRVAFIGVNSDDHDGDAKAFLAENPVPYRHFTDPDLEIASLFHGVQAFPVTAFYDPRGKLAYVHMGPYSSEQKLAEDIDRYAR